MEKVKVLKLSEIIEGGNVIVSLSERALGRVVAKDIKNPLSGEIIINKEQMIDEEACEKIDAAGVLGYQADVAELFGRRKQKSDYGMIMENEFNLKNLI